MVFPRMFLNKVLDNNCLPLADVVHSGVMLVKNGLPLGVLSQRETMLDKYGLHMVVLTQSRISTICMLYCY